LNGEGLEEAIVTLDTCEIEQFAQYDGVCELCQTPFYGILDESKCIIPPGNACSLLKRVPLEQRKTGEFTFFNFGYTAYEARQQIVRSGLYTRDQLKGVYPFNQHELEVNDRSFMNVRPRRCECDFGSPNLNDYEAELLRQFGEEPDTLTGVDEDFILGRPVRTGFRLRSKEALRRRRNRAHKKAPVLAEFFLPVREVLPTPHPAVKPGCLTLVLPEPIKLLFRKVECVLPMREVKKQFKPSCSFVKAEALNRRVNLQNPPPREAPKKYKYFFRKRAFWRPSVHHPVGVARDTD